MKALVVYYSRSGNTANVAHEIADALGAEVEPILDTTPRAGVLGYLRSGFEAAFRRQPYVSSPKHALSSYDVVVIGTPIWNMSLSSPVRAFISRHRKDLPRVAFLCTYGGSGAERVFREMTRVAGKSPTDVLALREAELEGDYSARIALFVRDLRAVLEPTSHAA